MANLVVNVTDAITADPPDNMRLSGTAGIEGNKVNTGWLIEVPFTLTVDEVNARCIAAGIEAVARRGETVGPDDVKRLFGGAVQNSSLIDPPRIAHVVMKGTTVDSVFVDALGVTADVAARSRADALAEATAGISQDDALKSAPWITTVPVNPR